MDVVVTIESGDGADKAKCYQTPEVDKLPHRSGVIHPESYEVGSTCVSDECDACITDSLRNKRLILLVTVVMCLIGALIYSVISNMFSSRSHLNFPTVHPPPNAI